MSINSAIVKDTRAARRFRLLAPIAALIALAALALAPGIIAELRSDATTVGTISPAALSQLAARPVEALAATLAASASGAFLHR